MVFYEREYLGGKKKKKHFKLLDDTSLEKAQSEQRVLNKRKISTIFKVLHEKNYSLFLINPSI